MLKVTFTPGATLDTSRFFICKCGDGAGFPRLLWGTQERVKVQNRAWPARGAPQLAHLTLPTE